MAKTDIPRGKPVSGRVWKSVQKSRSSSLRTKATKNLSSSWEKKIQQRRSHQNAVAMEREMKEKKQKAKENAKKEREEREKRRIENELKSTQYQVITRTDKLKNMSKKQLRQIKKTRMSKHGVVELVGAYQK